MVQYARIYGGYAVLVAAAMLLCFIVILVFTAMARRRGRAAIVFVRGLLWLFAIACAATVVVITLLPTASRGRTLDLVPLRTVAQMIATPTSTTPLQLFGNVALLSWLGFCLPLLFKRLDSIRTVTIIGIVVSVLIETTQWVTGNGRAATLDDVILNSIGVWLGAWLGVRKAAPRLRALERAQPGRHRVAVAASQP